LLGTKKLLCSLNCVNAFGNKLIAVGLAIGFVPTGAFSQSSANASGATAMVQQVEVSPAAASTYTRDVLPIFLGKCFSCHNDQVKFLPDWSDYPTAFAHRVEIKRRVWDSWKGNYYKESMPVGNSPQCLAMTEADRQTIKRWVEQGAVYGDPPAQVSVSSRTDRLDSGRRLFGTVCMPCHQAGGQGLPGRFPPLAASDFLNADKSRAIQTLLNGRTGEITVNGQRFTGEMPRLPFDDAQIASVLTYVYSSFGNSGQDVSPDEVKSVRAQKVGADPKTKAAKTDNKPSPWE
jgi:mono/diheme cytochrome c family protein